MTPGARVRAAAAGMVPGVNRHRTTLLLPLAAALIVGCSSVSDTDTVARVEDAELSSSELAELVDIFVQADPTNGDASRATITQWVRIEAIKHRLEESNITLTEEEIDAATTQMSEVVPDFAGRSDFVRDVLVEAQAAFDVLGETGPVSEAEIEEFYALGPTESGIACVSHILVETEDEAEEALAELVAGTPFADVAMARSIDPGSGAAGGALGCTTTENFQVNFVAPFVEGALAAEVGVPTGPVESEFGFHVIRVQPLDEVRPELEGFFASTEFVITYTIQQLDVEIDPRYGALLGSTVVPLT